MWKCCVAAIQWKDNQARDRERRSCRGCVILRDDVEAQKDCTVQKETFCLIQRDGEREVEVISPPEHIHFTVFSSTLPLDITSSPLQAIIPPFAIIYVAKSLHLHTYLSCLCTHTAKKKKKRLQASHGDHQRKPDIFKCS